MLTFSEEDLFFSRKYPLSIQRWKCIKQSSCALKLAHIVASNKQMNKCLIFHIAICMEKIKQVKVDGEGLRRARVLLFYTQ